MDSKGAPPPTMKIKLIVRIQGDKGDVTEQSFEGEGSDYIQRVVIPQLMNFLNLFIERPMTSSWAVSDFSVRERIEGLMRFESHGEWMTSNDVKRMYEEKYSEEIKLSTVSTYLARLHRRGLLDRRGSRRQREYRYAAAPPIPDASVMVEK